MIHAKRMLTWQAKNRTLTNVEKNADERSLQQWRGGNYTESEQDSDGIPAES